MAELKTVKNDQDVAEFLNGVANEKRRADAQTILTLYIMAGFSQYDDLMAQLGKFKIGKSCLYIKKLEDIDLDVLRRLIEASIVCLNEIYPEPTAKRRVP